MHDPSNMRFGKHQAPWGLLHDPAQSSGNESRLVHILLMASRIAEIPRPIKDGITAGRAWRRFFDLWIVADPCASRDHPGGAG
jgi:hypothetical protein